MDKFPTPANYYHNGDYYKLKVKNSAVLMNENSWICSHWLKSEHESQTKQHVT